MSEKCSICGLPIEPGRWGRHMGQFVAHHEAECIRMLAEAEWLIGRAGPHEDLSNAEAREWVRRRDAFGLKEAT